jgi:hypothetical protein
MSDRYAAYTKLKIDYPSKRVLRLTFDRPDTYNSVDAETHTHSSPISGGTSTTIPISTPLSSPGRARRFPPAAISS